MPKLSLNWHTSSGAGLRSVHDQICMQERAIGTHYSLTNIRIWYRQRRCVVTGVKVSWRPSEGQDTYTETDRMQLFHNQLRVASCPFCSLYLSIKHRPERSPESARWGELQTGKLLRPIEICLTGNPSLVHLCKHCYLNLQKVLSIRSMWALCWNRSGVGNYVSRNVLPLSMTTSRHSKRKHPGDE